jgi:Arc/MetJ family transcription regulator
MPTESTRTTIYLDADLHQALRMKAAIRHCSVSELVNNAVREALREDAEDLAAIEDRAGEQTYAFEDVVKWLARDGKL